MERECIVHHGIQIAVISGTSMLIFMYAIVLHYLMFQSQIGNNISNETNINCVIYKNEGPLP